MKFPLTHPLSRSILAIAMAFMLAPNVALADDEGGDRQGGIFSGIFGREERGSTESEEQSGRFSSGEGDEEAESREEGGGRFSNREGGEEEDNSRGRRFFGGRREGGERESDDD